MNASSILGQPPRYGSQTKKGRKRMLSREFIVPPAISKGAGRSRRIADINRQPLQEPRGGGFRTGRRALAPADDVGTYTYRPCLRLDGSPSARSLSGCSRFLPAKTLPVETIRSRNTSFTGDGKCCGKYALPHGIFLAGGYPRVSGLLKPIREFTKHPQSHIRS